jgi:transketolase
LLYSVLATMNEFMKAAHESTGEEKFKLNSDPHRVVSALDLLNFRRNGGLAGHAEMEGKTLFVKANTGPSGHGVPAGAGEAMSLIHSGAKDVCVFTMEGEGGLSAGAAHETKNSAYGLGLENYIMLLDWNDFGIDDTRHSRVVNGTPESWFKPYGWRVVGTEDATDFVTLIGAYRELLQTSGPAARHVVGENRKAAATAFTTQIARRGAQPNSDIFWETKRPFQEKYGVKFEGFGEAAPDKAAFRAQTRANIEIVLDVLKSDKELIEFVTGRLLAAADAVPVQHPGMWWKPDVDPAQDPQQSSGNEPRRLRQVGIVRQRDFERSRRAAVVLGLRRRPRRVDQHRRLRQEVGRFRGLWLVRPRIASARRRAAAADHRVHQLGDRGAPVDGELREKPGRALRGLLRGLLHLRIVLVFEVRADAVVLATGAGLAVESRQGDLGGGPLGSRDCEDSRTHFGIFAGRPICSRAATSPLHPYDHNETIVMLAAAMGHDAHVIALHLTRPNVETMDREALGAASHLDAAKGAYVIKDWDDSRGPRAGTVIFRGTSPVDGAFKLIRDHADELPNVKLVGAPSYYSTSSRRPAGPYCLGASGKTRWS